MIVQHFPEAAEEARRIAARVNDGEMLMMNMKRRRQAAGMSQEALAARIGVSQSSLQQWEQGRYWPSAFWLPKLAAALRCSIEELFMEADR